MIYWDLVHEVNHVPASIRKYPENLHYFELLKNNKFSDPFLREFLYRLYHCRLIFKRYKMNINDFLNTGQRCILCYEAIDTPLHCFQYCSFGNDLRRKRDQLLMKINNNTDIRLTEESKTFCNIDTNQEIDCMFNYINALSNYFISN